MNTSELQSLLSNRDNLGNALLDIEKVREQELSKVNTKFDEKIHRLNRHAKKGNETILEEVKKRYLNVNHGKTLKGFLKEPLCSYMFNYRIGLKSNSFGRVLETNADFLPDVEFTVGVDDTSMSALLSELYPSEYFLITQKILTKIPWSRHFSDSEFYENRVYLVVDIKGDIIGAFPNQDFYKGGKRYAWDRQYHIDYGRNRTDLSLFITYNGNILNIDDSYDNMMLKTLLHLVYHYEHPVEPIRYLNTHGYVLSRDKALDELWEDQECT